MPLGNLCPLTANERTRMERSAVVEKLVEYYAFDVEGKSERVSRATMGDFERGGNAALSDITHGMGQRISSDLQVYVRCEVTSLKVQDWTEVYAR